eukprot:gene11755-13715_t
MNIKLRKWDMKDLDLLVRYANNWNIAKNLNDMFPFPYGVEQGRTFIELTSKNMHTAVFAIDLDGAAIGGISMDVLPDVHHKNAEIGYWLAEPFWGKGMMCQAIEKMLDYIFFNYQVERVVARPFGSNTASHRVLEKAGFQLEGRFEKTLYKNGEESFHQICDELAWRDKELATVMRNYGYPPMWTRSNSFESLVHIILEQQVSLASALAALNKLKEKIVEITPENVLVLSDEELRACYFSRQKTVYVKHLAQVLADKKIDLNHLPLLPDEEVRKILNQLKGVGNWTIDVYLMFVLQRTDIFPVGDLAAVNAFKKLKGLPADTTKEQLITIARNWGPYRTVATMLLWHYYLSLRTKS